MLNLKDTLSVSHELFGFGKPKCDGEMMTCDVAITNSEMDEYLEEEDWVNGSELWQYGKDQDGRDNMEYGMMVVIDYFKQDKEAEIKTSKDCINSFKWRVENDLRMLRHIKASLSKHKKTEPKQFCLSKNGMPFKLTVDYLCTSSSFSDDFEYFFKHKNECIRDPERRRAYDFVSMMIFKYIKEYNIIGKDILSKCKKI